MKTILTAALLLCLSVAYGQTDSTAAAQQINGRLKVYFQANEEKDFDTILDMVYPKLFDMVPREMVKEQFAAMKGQGMDFRIYDMGVDSLSAPFVHESEQFVEVGYSHRMDMVMTDSSSQAAAPTMLGLFQAQYGEDKVTYDESAYTFRIQLAKTMLAIAPIDSRKWMFIDFQRDKPALLSMLFPEKVVQHFTGGQ